MLAFLPWVFGVFDPVFCFRVFEKIVLIAFSRPGSDLLSRVLRRSTIGAGAFHGRVRNGNGCGRPAMTTRSFKGNVMRSWQAFACFYLNTSDASSSLLCSDDEH